MNAMPVSACDFAPFFSGKGLCPGGPTKLCRPSPGWASCRLYLHLACGDLRPIMMAAPITQGVSRLWPLVTVEQGLKPSFRQTLAVLKKFC